MSKVYVMEDDDSGTKPLERVACVNEDKELQLLLERNLDLLPGDQIIMDIAATCRGVLRTPSTSRHCCSRFHR